MESNWRTVLADTLSGATSYSSGPLDVGDIGDLLLTVHTTAISNPATYIMLNAVDANGNLYPVIPSHVQAIASTTQGLSIGESFGSQLFGDRIQVDLQIPSGETITAQISVLGRAK